LFALALSAFPTVSEAEIVLVPYGATGYRYQITDAVFPPVGSVLIPYGSAGYRFMVTTGDFPDGVEQPDFDDSEYAIGAAPFGGEVGSGIYAGTTLWPASTRLVARLRFDIVGDPRPTTLRFGVDNNATIFINGTPVSSVTNGGTHYDNFRVRIPDGVLHTGQNLLVVLAVDEGGSSAFDASLTTGVELPDFDDTGYATGSAPFSNGTGPGIYSPATYWAENRKLIARLRFNVPGAPADAQLKFGIDNEVTVFINGRFVASGSLSGPGCGGCWPADYDNYVVPIPDGILVPGENLLVALAEDEGGNTAFDVSVTAEFATKSLRTSWGGLKALYRPNLVEREP